MLDTKSRVHIYQIQDSLPDQPCREKQWDYEHAHLQGGAYYGDSTQLLYLRSRFYASGTGRFLTRDTWSGNAEMPMSYNKWAYASANPILYTDPSGLFSCNQVPREDRGECEIFRSDFAKLGITLNGNWSSVDLIAIRQAISLVGQKFLTTPAGRSGGNSPLTAFKRVYGLNSQQTLKLSWNIDCPMCKPSYCREDGNANKEDYSVDDPNLKIPLFDGTKVTCDCKPKGGYTHGEHSIEFASLWPNFTQYGTYWQSVRKTNNIIHELGHAFNQRAGQAPQKAVASYSEYVTIDGASKLFEMNKRYKVQRGFYTDSHGTMTWVQSTQDATNEASPGSEVFADMFLGWVYGKWAPNPYGVSRAKFMNTGMPNWVAMAIGKP